MTADVIYPLSPEVTALQFLLEHEDEYRQHWRSCMAKQRLFMQRMRNPRLDLYRRVEAACDLLELDRHLKALGAMTGPSPIPQDPPAIIYRIPPLDPTRVIYSRVTRSMKPKPPFEPLEGWVHVLADDHPLRIAAGFPPRDVSPPKEAHR